MFFVFLYAAVCVDILNYDTIFWCNACVSLASMLSNTSQDLARPFTDQERMGSSTQELHRSEILVEISKCPELKKRYGIYVCFQK